MNVNNRLPKILHFIVPILTIALMTLCCLNLYLYKGIPGGDDVRFHLGNIFDVWYGMKNGLGIDSTNHVLMGAYSYNTHLFYAPLPHYGAAILMYVFNCTAITGLKWFVAIMTYFAGLMFYCLSYKITKRMSVSLFSAAFFLFCPYRMFCGYARFAYAETIAMCFIPCFFYGIYSIIHDETPKAWSFLAVVVGACGLILSHPFTAISLAIVAILYMVVHIDRVWALVKTKKGIIFALSSVLLIILGVGFYAFPMVKALGSNIYRMSDHQAVWTNFKHVSDSTKNSSDFSGFLNLVWIASRIKVGAWPEAWTTSYLVLEVALVFVGAILAATADFILGRLPNNKFYRLPMMIMVSYLPLCFFKQRVEVYLAMALFDVLLIITEFIKDKSEGYFVKKDWFKRNKSIMIDVIFFLVVSAIVLVFIYVGKAWAYVPSLFYTCQFAWRLWSVICLTASVLFVYGLNATTYIKDFKIPFYLGSIVPFLLFSASQAYTEKKYAIDTNNIYQAFTYEDARKTNNIGVMNEYIPVIFYDWDYESEYWNSLYRQIRTNIGNWNRYIQTKEAYTKPAFLEGSGTVTVTELNAPSVDFKITVDNNALIQIPQFFYDGYEIQATNVTTGEVTKLEPISIDSLVSFRLNVGEYDVKVRYEGPKLRRVFNKLWYVGLVGDLALAGFGIYELVSKKKEKAE